MTEGRPPTAREKVGFVAADEMAPAKSLARIQELAKFVFSNVAVIGTLLTGLGLFTDLGKVLEDTRNLPGTNTPVPLAALGLSLLCASFALWPKMSNVDAAQLDSVLAWYAGQIKRRGIWIILSLGLFSTAIASATFSGLNSEPKPADPKISASWTGHGQHSTIYAKVEIEKLPTDALARTKIVGVKGNRRRVTLFTARTKPDADGTLTVDATIDTVQVKRAIITSAITAKTGTITSCARIQRGPATPAPRPGRLRR